MNSENILFPIKYNVNNKIDLLTLDKISYLFVNEQYDILLLFYNSTKNSKNPVFDLIILLSMGCLFLVFSLIILISFINFRLSFEFKLYKKCEKDIKTINKFIFFNIFRIKKEELDDFFKYDGIKNLFTKKLLFFIKFLIFVLPMHVVIVYHLCKTFCKKITEFTNDLFIKQKRIDFFINYSGLDEYEIENRWENINLIFVVWTIVVIILISILYLSLC